MADPISRPSTDDIAGLYLGIEWQLEMIPDMFGGSSTALRLSDAQAMFLPDGRYQHDGLPDRGLEEELAPELKPSDDSHWGHWERVGDEVTAHSSGPDLHFTVTAQGLKGEYGTWHRLGGMAPTTIDGVYRTWAHAEDPQSPRVRFHPDGAFEEVGAFFALVGTAANLVDPAVANDHVLTAAETADLLRPGRGTYQARNYTLTLRYSDGRLYRQAFSIPLSQSKAGAPDQSFSSSELKVFIENEERSILESGPQYTHLLVGRYRLEREP